MFAATFSGTALEPDGVTPIPDPAPLPFLIGAGGLGHIGIQVLAALCAAEVISHTGARPEADLKTLAAAAGLLPG